MMKAPCLSVAGVLLPAVLLPGGGGMRSILSHEFEGEEAEPEVQSAYETKLNAQKEVIGCYCKQVKEVSECPHNKYPLDETKPNGPRLFHENATLKGGGQGNLCCKADYVSVSLFVGMKYKKYDDMLLCEEEVRAVPERACCVLRDRTGGDNHVGVQVRQAFAGVSPYRYYDGTWNFPKSAPLITVEDIVGGFDWDGERLDAQEVQDFVRIQQANGRFGEEGNLFCGGPRGSFVNLFASAEHQTSVWRTCRIRKEHTTECCCHQSTLEAASRCLPLEGGAAVGDAPITLTGNYTETNVHGKKKGHLSMPLFSDPDVDLVSELRDVADPEAQNNQDTSVNESSLKYNWVPGNQWKNKCVQFQRVGVVKTKRIGKRVELGQRCAQIGGHTHCSPMKRTVYTNEYIQGWKKQCISYQYTRICPAGTGLFNKQIKQGKYFKEPSVANEFEMALNDAGARTFECPDEYKSGTFGTAKYDEMCRCQEL